MRSQGVDVLVDPGTYCYHGEPEWRSHFRSTRAHNTVEVDGVSQSVEGGPFLWSTLTDAVVDRSEEASEGQHRRLQVWTAHHTGYARLDPALRHTRQVTLDSLTGELAVLDTLTGSTRHTARLFWHLGPEVSLTLRGHEAELAWPSSAGVQRALLHLPAGLAWTAHRGESGPIAGWYSPRFGERIPTTTLVGTGAWEGAMSACTSLRLVGLQRHGTGTPRTTTTQLEPELALGRNVPRSGGTP